MGINFSFNIRRKTKFLHNGVEYDSFDQLPEEIRRRIEAEAPEAARAARLSVNAEPEDEPLEDLSPAGPSAPQPGCAARPWGGWGAGVMLFGLLFLVFGADISYRVVKSGKYSPFFVTAGLLFLACGGGLVAQKRWARPLALLFSPVAALIALGLMHKAGGRGTVILLPALAVCSAAFVWLLLPPVERLFEGRKQPLAGRRLAAAAPAPRGISRELRLAVLFGNNFVLMSLFVLALVFVPSLDKLHGILGGLREGFADLSAAWLVLPGAFLFAVAVSAFTVRWALRFGRMQLDRLANWRLCYAVLKSKVKITDGDSEVYRMKFEYEVGGLKYTNISDMNFISALEDEAEEPMLYDPLKPRRSMLVDELPASVILDERGGFTCRRPFMGYLYASLPPLLLAALAIAAFR